MKERHVFAFLAGTRSLSLKMGVISQFVSAVYIHVVACSRRYVVGGIFLSCLSRSDHVCRNCRRFMT